MNFYELSKMFMFWGKQIKESEFENFKRYFSIMLTRNRVLAISSESGLECIICYFLTDEMDSFINRPMWSTPKDTESGRTFFVDKMVAKHWTPSLRKLVQSEVEQRFPSVTRAHWLREPNNRSVIINKRGINVYSQMA